MHDLMFFCILFVSYNEFLKLSQKGDNVVLDLIVRDICGELVCQKVPPLSLSLSLKLFFENNI